MKSADDVTQDVTDDGVDSGTDADSTSEPTWRRRRKPNPLTIVGVVLVLIATACAVVFATLWSSASHDDSLTYSQLRDSALRAAEQGSINLTTLDYRDVQQGLNRWKDSTTGPLHTELNAGGLVSTFNKEEQSAKSVTTGRVLDGVITDLDEHAGTAQALIYMDVTVTAPGSQPTDKRLPLQWQLQLTSSGWKLACLGSCPSSGQ